MASIETADRVERRHLKPEMAELRAEEEDGRWYLKGYAAVYNSLSEDLGGFRERIKTGAFRRAIDEGRTWSACPITTIRPRNSWGGRSPAL